ncbi:MAG: tRNA lysidine(34) synthetase TilS [Halobacteriovoraceae bacterium]|nr:tRNA lysidine(34) synthetase TilS [Halobacteriovoraceae bacterium]
MGQQYHPYIFKFLKHFEKFIAEYELFQKDDELLLAVSGGIDSMCLVRAMSELESFGYSLRLRIIHIHHGTRVEQDREAQMVESYAKHLSLPCEVIKLQDLNPHKNFEYRARQKRYEAFYERAKSSEKIVLAHHIDDSFEWTLLQSLKSSSIEGVVGIPLVNHKVIRPFFCVTKAQIEKFADILDIPFLEDPTNDQIKFERNFLRQEVIPAFSGRHPKYLKHYVYRHNEIARRLGVHLKEKDQSSFKVHYQEQSVLLFNTDSTTNYSGLENQVLGAIKYLAPLERGKLHAQLSKLKKALEHKKIGPLNLVGEYKAYLDYNLVLITAENAPQLCFKYKDFKTFSYSEYQNYLNEWLSQGNNLAFPFIVFIQNPYIDKRQFATSFNNEQVKSFCSEQSNYYPALRLLREWSKKRNRHRVLRLNFLVTL